MTPSDKLEMLSDEEKAEIIDHMNSDHADAVLTYVHFFGNREDALSASLTSVTEEKMHISMICDDGEGGQTKEAIATDLSRRVGNIKEAERVMVEMVFTARGTLEL